MLWATFARELQGGRGTVQRGLSYLELLGGARLTRPAVGCLVQVTEDDQRVAALGDQRTDLVVAVLVDGVATPVQDRVDGRTIRGPALDGPLARSSLQSYVARRSPRKPGRLARLATQTSSFAQIDTLSRHGNCSTMRSARGLGGRYAALRKNLTQ